MPKTITQLPAAAAAESGAVVAADNAAGTVTEKVTLAQIVALPHAHSASAIESGIIDPARLATGTANSTTYLRGDSTWATVTSGSTNAGDLTSGTLGFQRLPSRVRVATNMYLWNTFR